MPYGSCHIEGRVRVRADVPGGLLISSRVDEDRMETFDFDMSHHVEYLVFDDDDVDSFLSGRFDGKDFDDDDSTRVYDHFTRLVETNILKDGSVIRTYFDYTGSSTSHDIDRSCHVSPYVHFVYDIEAYALNRWLERGPGWISFLVSLFAILGGVVTIASVFDGTIFTVFYQRKARHHSSSKKSSSSSSPYFNRHAHLKISDGYEVY